MTQGNVTRLPERGPSDPDGEHHPFDTDEGEAEEEADEETEDEEEEEEEETE